MTPTFLEDCPLDAAADEGVVGHLVPDQVEDEGHPAGVLEGDFADQSSLEASSIRERSVFVQEVTVLLSWQGLENNPCLRPAGCEGITDTKSPFWLTGTNTEDVFLLL